MALGDRFLDGRWVLVSFLGLVNAGFLVTGVLHLAGSLASVRARGGFDTFHDSAVVLVGLDHAGAALGQLLLARRVWARDGFGTRASVLLGCYQVALFVTLGQNSFGPLMTLPALALTVATARPWRWIPRVARGVGRRA